MCCVEIIYILFIVHERNKVRSMAIYAISDHGFIMSLFFFLPLLSNCLLAISFVTWFSFGRVVIRTNGYLVMLAKRHQNMPPPVIQ